MSLYTFRSRDREIDSQVTEHHFNSLPSFLRGQEEQRQKGRYVFQVQFEGATDLTPGEKLAYLTSAISHERMSAKNLQLVGREMENLLRYITEGTVLQRT